MKECCNSETKDPMNKVPLYASFDAILYALYFNPQESVTCSLMTGELVLETKNSLSGHIVQKFRECTQMDFPPTLGNIKGRQMDGARVPLWRGTALYLVDDIFKALGTKDRLSFPSRYKFWSKVGCGLILAISDLSFLLGIEAISTFGSILISTTLIVGVVFILSKLSTSNKHYKPKCNCSEDELVAHIASLDPNDYEANSVSVELIKRARWKLKNKVEDITSRNVEPRPASEELEKTIKLLKIGKELFEKTIEDRDQTIGKLEKEVADKNSEIVELQAKSEAQSKTIEDKDQKIEKLEKEAADTKSEIVELRAKSEAQSKTIEDKDQKIEKLEKEVADSKSEIAVLEAKNEESEKIIEALKADQEKTTEKNVELEKKLQNMQESIVGGLSGAFESWQGFKLEEIISKEKPKPELYFVYIGFVWYKACCKLSEYYRSYSKSQCGPNLPSLNFS